MENGKGGHAAISNGDTNSDMEPLRSIRYRVLGRKPRFRYLLSSSFPRCPCRETYTYPNDLILSIDVEHRQLLISNRVILIMGEGLRAIVEA